MSFAPDKDPKAGDAAACDAIELMIVPRSVDLGGFSVRRALPHSRRRMFRAHRAGAARGRRAVARLAVLGRPARQ